MIFRKGIVGFVEIVLWFVLLVVFNFNGLNIVVSCNVKLEKNIVRMSRK